MDLPTALTRAPRWFPHIALLFLVGGMPSCARQRVDITPGPPQPDEALVVEVEVRETGGRVELVSEQVRRRAPFCGLGAPQRGVQQWIQEQLDHALLVELADVEPGQTAYGVVSNFMLPDYPLRLEVRFRGTPIWQGPVGTRWGGPNHLVLVVEDGHVVEKTEEVVDDWLDSTTRARQRYLDDRPDGHVRFETGRHYDGEPPPER